MKTYNISTRISAQARMEINRILSTHEKYRKSFFYTSNSSASGRRSNEEKFAAANKDVCFITENSKIEVSMSYSESCRNVYYSISIIVDGKSKNITAIKKLTK